MTTTFAPTLETRLRDYLHVLQRHRWVVLLVMLLTVLIGTVPVAFSDPVYASTASLRVGSLQDESPFTSLPDNAQNVSRELLSEVEVLKSTGMRAAVAERLGDGGPSFGDVTAEAVNYSEVIDVTVEAGSPADAADVANAYADVFVDQRRKQSVEALTNQSTELRRRAEDATADIADIDRELADPATAPARRDSITIDRTSLASQASEFASRADELEVEAALREGGTVIVSRAELEMSPVAPKPFQSLIVSLVLGVLLGITVAVALEVLQDRVSSSEDLDAVDPDVPVLASIPHHDPHAPPSSRTAQAAAEAYRYLRTSLRFRALQVPAQSLVVTSATAAEGKTTTAVRLASALADGGQRVVLVDADVRRPAVHTRLDLPNEGGLTVVLHGVLSLAEAVQYARPNLVVLTAGPPSTGPTELLGREAFAKVVSGLASQCDCLIIDAPPVLPVADPLLAARLVDGVLLVARVGKVRRRTVRAALRRLSGSGLAVVGLIANDADVETTYYGDYSSSDPAAPGKSTKKPPKERPVTARG